MKLIKVDDQYDKEIRIALDLTIIDSDHDNNDCLEIEIALDDQGEPNKIEEHKDEEDSSEELINDHQTRSDDDQINQTVFFENENIFQEEIDSNPQLNTERIK